MPDLRQAATSRFAKRAFLVSAVLMSILVIVVKLSGHVGDTWDSLPTVVAALLWIGYINASLHLTISEEVNFRMERLAGELAEQQSRDTDRIIKELTTHFNQVDFVGRVVREVGRQYQGEHDER